MDSFRMQGLQNPTKAVTNKGFWKHLVKGIIKDDLPYSLREKVGMLKLFEYLLPHSISTPLHQTIRRDLDTLYKNLDEKLNSQLQAGNLLSLCHRCKLILFILVIQSNHSKIAITSNLWTSKNSVYTFAGTVAFWIDNNWNLNECVLELLPLDGDHLGKALGKLIFNALHR